MATCPNILTDITDAYADAKSQWYWLDSYVSFFQSAYPSHSFNSTWRQYVYLGFDSIHRILIQLITGHPSSTAKNKMIDYLTNCVGGNGVDMDAILTAMLAAEYDELQQFIGIVDAYRVALWDTWFNTEFYAALARGFKQLRP